MSFKQFKSRGTVVLFLFLVAGLIILGACKKTPSEQAGEKMISDMLSKATGGKAEVDLRKGEIKVETPGGESVIIAGQASWPVDLPEDIRKFEAGTIQGATKSQQESMNTWMVIFKNVKEDELTAYVDELKGDGWSVQMETSMEGGTYTQVQKDNWNITLSFSHKEQTLGLNLIQQKED